VTRSLEVSSGKSFRRVTETMKLRRVEGSD
jgi:hypothetical protein